jgi:hypothetical protein
MATAMASVKTLTTKRALRALLSRASRTAHQNVRAFLTRAKTTTPATAKESHKVLRSAPSAACSEELISRNVAKLVDPPRVESKQYDPWTIEETRAFVQVVRGHHSYAAIMLAIGLELRRG